MKVFFLEITDFDDGAEARRTLKGVRVVEDGGKLSVFHSSWSGTTTEFVFLGVDLSAEEVKDALRYCGEGWAVFQPPDTTALMARIVALRAAGIHVPAVENGLLQQLIQELLKRGWIIVAP